MANRHQPIPMICTTTETPDEPVCEITKFPVHIEARRRTTRNCQCAPCLKYHNDRVEDYSG